MAMASFHLPPLALLLVLVVTVAHARLEPTIRLPSDDDTVGTRWAVLVAGSNGYQNYRHQVRTLYDGFYSLLIRVSSRDPPIFFFLSVKSIPGKVVAEPGAAAPACLSMLFKSYEMDEPVFVLELRRVRVSTPFCLGLAL